MLLNTPVVVDRLLMVIQKLMIACRYYGALIVAALHDCPKDLLLDKQFLFET